MTQLINNYKLFGYDEIFAKFKAMENDKILPNKILLSGPKGIGKFTFSIHFINYILSLNEENKYDDVNFTINQYNKSFSLMNNLSHPNLSIVNLKSNKKNIEIDQIRNIITNSQKSSFNSKKRFILVDNVEFLNINASNALLKILEEPPGNIYFILILDSSKKIPDTIKSRSIVFKKHFSNKETIAVINKIIDDDIEKLMHKCFLNKYSSIGELIFLLDFAKQNEIDLNDIEIKDLLNFMIYKKFYKSDHQTFNLMINLIHCFFYEIYTSTKDNDFFNLYSDFIQKINSTLKYNLDTETLFFEFKNKIINE